MSFKNGRFLMSEWVWAITALVILAFIVVYLLKKRLTKGALDDLQTEQLSLIIGDHRTSNRHYGLNGHESPALVANKPLKQHHHHARANHFRMGGIYNAIHSVTQVLSTGFTRNGHRRLSSMNAHDDIPDEYLNIDDNASVDIRLQQLPDDHDDDAMRRDILSNIVYRLNPKISRLESDSDDDCFSADTEARTYVEAPEGMDELSWDEDDDGEELQFRGLPVHLQTHSHERQFHPSPYSRGMGQSHRLHLLQRDHRPVEPSSSSMNHHPSTGALDDGESTDNGSSSSSSSTSSSDENESSVPPEISAPVQMTPTPLQQVRVSM